MKCPSEDMKEVWSKMTYDEKMWYITFLQAERGNVKAFSYVAGHLNPKRFHEMLKEIRYENNANTRFHYTINDIRKPRYSEWDYGWAAKPVSYNRRTVVDKEYFGEQEVHDPEPGKPLFKIIKPDLKPRKGSRASGTNKRAMGTNKRALGTNPRALGTNPRALKDSGPDIADNESTD